MSELRSKSIRAFVWDFFGSFSNQIVGFSISIILARILSPEEFGLIGMVMVFTAVAQVFMDMGFGSAIVQSNKVDENVYSSVFWLNLIIGFVLTLSIYLSAKPIASFYENEALIAITQWISIVFFISSFGVMQRTRCVKELNFKIQTIISLIALSLSGVLAIYLSYNGFGVFALVYQRIAYTFIDVLSYWIFSSWRPKFYFKLDDIKSIWGFSSKQFLDSTLSTIYSKLDVLMIGKAFDSKTLGFYTRAFSMNHLISQFTTTSLGKIFFPLISQIQSNIEKVRNVYERVIRLISFISILLAGVFYIVADDLFIILFTDKWFQSIFIFKYLVSISFFYPISVIMLSVISGLGFPGRVLTAGVYKKIINIAPIIIGFIYGIESFLIFRIVFGLFGFWVNCIYLRKTIQISIVNQVEFFIKPLAIGLILSFCINSVVDIENIYLSLILRSFLFGIPFIIGTLMLDLKLRLTLLNEYGIFVHQYKNRKKKYNKF